MIFYDWKMTGNLAFDEGNDLDNGSGDLMGSVDYMDCVDNLNYLVHQVYDASRKEFELLNSRHEPVEESI